MANTHNNKGNNKGISREPAQIDANGIDAAGIDANGIDAANVPGLVAAMNARTSVSPAIRGPALIDAAKAAKTWTAEQLVTATKLAADDAALSAVFAAESVRRQAREESATVKAAIRERDKGLALESAALDIASATARGARDASEVRSDLAGNVTVAAGKARDALQDQTLPLHDAIGEAVKPLRQAVSVMTGTRKVLTGDIRGASGKNAAAVLGLLYR